MKAPSISSALIIPSLGKLHGALDGFTCALLRIVGNAALVAVYLPSVLRSPQMPGPGKRKLWASMTHRFFARGAGAFCVDRRPDWVF